jgi:hypothetical protein
MSQSIQGDFRTSSIRLFAAVSTVAWLGVTSLPAQAEACRREGEVVRCDDGRVGTFVGDGILWPDGTRSRAVAQSPSVIVGNKSSVQIGPGVFVGNGRGGMEQMDQTTSNKRSCAVLDGVSYCH